MVVCHLFFFVTLLAGPASGQIPMAAEGAEPMIMAAEAMRVTAESPQLDGVLD